MITFRPNLDEELAWWGNAPFEWSFRGPSGTPCPMDWLNGEVKGSIIDIYSAWRRDCIGDGDPDSHPLVWQPEWKRNFMIGWVEDQEEECVPAAYPAVEKLHKLGVKVLSLLSEITETRLMIGPAEYLRRSLASREGRWRDVQKLEHGSFDEKWQVIEKWAPVLRQYTPSLKIIFLEAEDRNKMLQKFYVIQTWNPHANRFMPVLDLPLGAREIKWVQTKAYPDRKVLEELGQEIPDNKVLSWIAQQLLRLGPAKRHRPAASDIQRCALKLEELIRSDIGRSCYQEIGELLRAAFPEYFNPKGDIANATKKLLERAQKLKEK